MTKTEELIAKSMAELNNLGAKVEKEAISEEESEIEPSPKVNVNINDTYKPDWDNSLTKELVEDFKPLELQYKLKDNWLDITDEMERPFDPDYSIIKTSKD